VKPVRPDPAVINTPDEKAAKLAAGRAALAGVEAKLGVRPVVVAPAESVTKSPDERHEKSAVTKSPMGRPKKERVLTAAERAKAARDRKKERGE
jgi:carbamoylphosphate synthase large subunit